MLLSIIIPVYNVEKYIARTLESILFQHADIDYEVIIVDDGTPDGSMRIVDDYADKFPRMVILHQENRGLSCARNSGLQASSGEYVWFVDSDDTLPPHSLDFLASQMEALHPEVLTFDIVKTSEQTGNEAVEPILFKAKYRSLYGRQHAGTALNKKIHTGIAQRFVFRRDFLTASRLTFTPGIIHEDIDFIVRMLLVAGSILPLRHPCYNYLVRQSGSIMSDFKPRSCTDRLKIMTQWELLRSEKKWSARQRALIDDNLFTLGYHLITSPLRRHPAYRDFLQRHGNRLRKMATDGAWHSMTAYFSLGKLAKVLRLMLFRSSFRHS